MKTFNVVALAVFLCAFSTRAHEGDDGLGEVIPGEFAACVPCKHGVAAGFPCRGIDLLSFLPADQFGTGLTNDLWDWTDRESGREFVIIGRVAGVEFIEITDPTHPIHLGSLPAAADPSIWHDMKVVGHYAYVVSDFTNHGMQVFDLTSLLSVDMPAVGFAPLATYRGLSGAHNLAINDETEFAYAVGIQTCSGGLHVIDIADPSHPQFAGCFSDTGYTHDA